MKIKEIDKNTILSSDRKNIIEIDYNVAVRFLLPKHYSGRKPIISKAFGWYDNSERTDEHLKAVCTFGKPASPWLCIGICGRQHSSEVYELNRLCRTEDWSKPLSYFVSQCLKRLKKENWIIVSYSDTGMNHHGYIYQACNFLYTGCTKERTDKYTPDGKHGRHYQDYANTDEINKYRKVRTAKHRYVYFCSYNKKKKQEWLKDLKYPICEYPKGDNSNYILGDYIKDQIIEV